ncbi:MAG: class I SAM-dependent methyltransferase [Hyphomicrobiales bacterium]|nr:class I SAM-dependent methyltransferase [Hyphomicrobiales bacterium]MCP4997261.1 class I SAM-dependent methyltransferase [Hyphomicrobiales bacterium]
MTSDNELPDSKSARVDWVIRAPDNAEMRRRYDIWAAQYDADIGTIDDYVGPFETVSVAKAHFDASALLMDAGAGTGLVGEALRREGFERLVAVDYSAQMLDIARAKGFYSEIHECDLSRPTGLESDRFDGVVSCGTSTQMPSASLREFVRVVRPGGKIVFAVLPPAWEDCGWAAIQAELEAAGKLSLIERNDPFQMMPTTESEFYCEVWVMAVA